MDDKKDKQEEEKDQEPRLPCTCEEVYLPMNQRGQKKCHNGPQKTREASNFKGTRELPVAQERMSLDPGEL